MKKQLFVFALFSILILPATSQAFLPISGDASKLIPLTNPSAFIPSTRVGLGESIHAAFGSDASVKLVGGDTLEISGSLSPASDLAPETVASHFVEGMQTQFLGVEGSAAALELDRSVVLNGSSHVRFRQVHEGLRVVGRQVNVHLDGRNSVETYQSNFDPAIAVANQRILDEDTALRIARDHLEVSGELRTRPLVEAVILPMGGHNAIQAFEVKLAAETPLGDWLVMIDAETGAVAACENRLQGAEGSFWNDSPLDGNVVKKTLKNMQDETNLHGKFAKVVNEDVDDATEADGKFNYDPKDTHFDEVMVYHHQNVIHDYFKTLGFNELDKAMQATVHYRTDYDNAFFSPWSQSFSYGDGNRLNDLATEAGVIYHEYTHAVTGAIQSMTYSGESGAMNEAFSDYFACTQDGDSRMGEWVMKKMNKPFMRNLVNDKHYPEDIDNEVHRDSEIYSACCWGMRLRFGRSVADQIIHRSRYYLSYSASFADGLASMLKADEKLFGGNHADAIKAIFEKKGITAQEAQEAPTQQNFENLYGSF